MMILFHYHYYYYVYFHYHIITTIIALAEMESSGIPIASDAELRAIPQATAVHQDHIIVNSANTNTNNKDDDNTDKKRKRTALALDLNLRRNPMFLQQCPYCYQSETQTRIRTFPTWQTWALSGALLILFWPLCWVPLVTKNCKQTDHFCASCGIQVGSIPAFHDCCVTHGQRG